MATRTDQTVTEICEKAILEIGSEPAVVNPEMYRVCTARNDPSAFLRFMGADSGARLAASPMELRGAAGALSLALARVRTLIGRTPSHRRLEPSDML
jgi:hypothetical protein